MKITDLFTPQETTAKQGPVPELKINVASVTYIKFFTQSIEKAKLHYEEDATLRGYLHCLKDDCPYCKVGKSPTEYCLIPVYSIESDEVVVLKFPIAEGAYRLFSQVRRLFDDPNITSKIISIKRTDKFSYFLEAIENDDSENWGVGKVKEFIDRNAIESVDLGAIWKRPTLTEMRTVPALARLLMVEAKGQSTPFNSSVRG